MLTRARGTHVWVVSVNSWFYQTINRHIVAADDESAAIARVVLNLGDEVVAVSEEVVG